MSDWNKHEFDFNSFWIANNSPNKKIAIRKTKVYRVPITCFVVFSINDTVVINIGNYNFLFSYTVNDNQNIVDFLNYLTEGINKKVEENFHNSEFNIEIKFTNNIMKFTSNIRKITNGFDYSPRIQFRDECDRLFHISLNRDALGNPMKYQISVGIE
jgi:hypothetical protein